ncbi:hypothetical protein N7456_000488 [Penicillium angulare]|uniref:Uncharacterized protein n=1 Tax=Penicillium angulare TaxID=116970 RepID=A0A9W9GD45_9EURO|nr:hypothetical protein N7456_000488 [Penicillium angulare]
MASTTAFLKGQAAIVTGGGSGINFSFVKLLVESGVNVLIADIALYPSTKTWLESHNPDETGSRVEYLQTDVRDWSQLERTFDVCIAQFGKCPDIVVPGAGVFDLPKNAFWEDVDKDGHYNLLDVNLVHPIKMTRLAIKHMLEAKKAKGDKPGICGTIVHVSSIAAQTPALLIPLYSASKSGVNSFVRSMANLQDVCGIRVVGVAPGMTSTPLMVDDPVTLSLFDPERDTLLPPEELARAMLSLVVDTDKYAAGTILEVCDTEGRWREVSNLNDPGPQGPGSTISGGKDIAYGIFKTLGVGPKI